METLFFTPIEKQLLNVILLGQIKFPYALHIMGSSTDQAWFLSLSPIDLPVLKRVFVSRSMKAQGPL